MNLSIRYILITVSLTVASAAFGQKADISLENMMSSWGTINFNEPLGYQAGGRYIPTLSVYDSLRNKQRIDGEFSVNTYGNFLFSGDNYDGFEGAFKPYRLWVRYSTPRLELRAGLQKINFGSASVLRPLMWFDKMDYRDPLQLTDGVYSLLGRYYFQKNTNIWLWILYGNTNTKGWETAPTKKHSPEVGGRVQVPVPGGEIGLTTHFRQADYSAMLDTIPGITETIFNEKRLGIDGKWDLVAGVWFEYVIYHTDSDISFFNEWETYFNVGLDYTVPIGNGITLTTEYFRYSNKAEFKEKGIDNNYSALALNYPVGLLNNITAAVYYNWNSNEWSRFINIQRQYDYWSFYLMGFWNPDDPSFNKIDQERNLFAGQGIQVMAVVNF